MPRPACPKCKELQCSRKKRVGLWQRFILPRFGWFPWECTSCRKVFLIKERGKSKRRHPKTSQTYNPDQPDQTTEYDRLDGVFTDE